MRRLLWMAAGAAMLATGTAQAQGAAQGPPEQLRQENRQQRQAGPPQQPQAMQQQMTPEQVIATMRQADEKEVRFGQLAAQRAQNPQVKQYGEMLVKHHSEHLKQVEQAAQKAGIDANAQPPSTPVERAFTQAGQNMEQALGQLQGAEFDRAFTGWMLIDHDHDIATLQNALPQVRGTPVGALVSKTLPILQQHRQQAHKLLGTLAPTQRQARGAPTGR